MTESTDEREAVSPDDRDEESTAQRHEGWLLAAGLLVAASGISLGARGISVGLASLDAVVLLAGALDAGAGLLTLRRSLAAEFDRVFVAAAGAVLAVSALLFVLTVGA